MKIGRLLLAALLAASLLTPASATEASCESLTALKLPDTTITMAQAIPAGQFAEPAGVPNSPGPALFGRLPAFCRVAATLKPTSDSDIKIEVWMPASGWNGKFQAVGNGGWNGNIVYPSLAARLMHGYATASTDTGHSGGSGSFALGHPEKLIDFGYRAAHEMTVEAKAIIAAFYGSGPKRSYWVGCSSGGKQGLKEAQKFPDDYDGIIAGAPANYWTHLMTGTLWIGHATLKDAASYIPPAKYPLMNKAVLEACDSLDGVADGILENPTRCHFDVKSLLCKGEDGPSCLTAAQVEAAKKIYGPAKNSRTGKQIFPGMAPGSELVWGALAGGPRPFAIPNDHFKYVVFKNPEWDWRTLNFDTDLALADKIDNNTINAIDPNLKKFTAHGGKLLLYHGWNDQLIVAQNSIDYYKSLAGPLGGASKVSESVRLFMVPGMGHCAGGPGPNTFDMVDALEQWVEKGKAPDRIIASHSTAGKVDRTRPLCPYPQVAHYNGSGSTDDAANFVCRTE